MHDSLKKPARPTRHRFYGVAFRLAGATAAFVAFSTGYGEIPAAMLLVAGCLLGVLHDLVSATLRKPSPGFIYRTSDLDRISREAPRYLREDRNGQ